MGKSIQLGKIFGIPFRLDYSWFLIFILITVMLSLYIFPEEWPTAARWGIGIATSVLFFTSVLAHELAHSLVGIRGGIPVKSITLFFFGGIAHIGKEASHPTTELKMALAGPLCSLTLAGIFYVLYLLLGGFSEYVAGLTFWLFWINGILAAFNMIPGFPLDGGRVLRAIIWRVTGNYLRASRIATMAGRGVSYVFILGGIGFIIFTFPEGLFNGLWFIFIGWFLNSAATMTYRQTTLRESLKGFTAQEVMTRDFPRVPRHLTISELVQGPLLTTSSQCFLVTDGESMAGLLTLQQVKEVPKEHRDITTTGQAMTPVENLKMVRPSDEALSILERMDEENLDLVTVVREGRIIGMVLRDNLRRFAQRFHDLKM